MSSAYLAWVLFFVAKWQSVCGVHKIQMPLPGCWVIAGTLMQSYGAENVASTRNDPISKHMSRKENKLCHASRNQERLCWRVTAAIYWTVLEILSRNSLGWFLWNYVHLTFWIFFCSSGYNVAFEREILNLYLSTYIWFQIYLNFLFLGYIFCYMFLELLLLGYCSLSYCVRRCIVLFVAGMKCGWWFLSLAVNISLYEHIVACFPSMEFCGKYFWFLRIFPQICTSIIVTVGGPAWPESSCATCGGLISILLWMCLHVV
jgi:hypothetical protein